jgi:hypothetical protein
MALTKTELYELLQLKKERERKKKPAYTPNAGQLPMHQSTKEIRFSAAGNGSGKTTAAVHEAIWAAQGYHPIKKKHTRVPADLAIVLDKPDKADKVWLKEIRKWFDIADDQLHKRGKPNTSEITFSNGSVITFYSHDQDPLTFESIELDAVIYDEPPPQHIFTALRRGTRKKGTVPWHLIIGTPLAAPWLRTKIWEPWSRGELPEADCFRFGTEVNKANINWEAQQRNFAFMSEHERLIRAEGHFFDLEGQALAHMLDRSAHVMPRTWEYSKDWPCIIAIDPHPAKAHIALLLTVDRDDRLYVIKEMSRKAVARDFAKDIKHWLNHHKVIDIVVDSLGSAELTGAEGYKSFIEVLNEEGVRARSTTYNEKSDEEFIDRLRTALQVPEESDNFGQFIPKLRFHADCVGIWTDLEQVQWVRDKKLQENKPKLDIQYKDYLACLKYALAANLTTSREKVKVINRVHRLHGFNTRSGAKRAARTNMLRRGRI